MLDSSAVVAVISRVFGFVDLSSLQLLIIIIIIIIIMIIIIDWFIIKSHRSKILNCVIIYKLLIYNYKYNGLKFY